MEPPTVQVSSDTRGLPPAITVETAAYWQAAGEGQLVVDRCTECGRSWFPARRWCGACQRSDTIDPNFVLSGPAVLYSYTVNHVSWLPGMAVPFVLGLAEFPDAPGVRIPCRVRADDPASVQVGATLEVGFEDGAGVRIPSFVVVDPVIATPA